MILSIILFLFMVLVPFRLKKAGIEYVMDKKIQGLILLLLSKLFWWFTFAQICLIWLPHQYILYLWTTMLVGIMIKLFMDRKYFYKFLSKK